MTSPNLFSGAPDYRGCFIPIGVKQDLFILEPVQWTLGIDLTNWIVLSESNLDSHIVVRLQSDLNRTILIRQQLQKLDFESNGPIQQRQPSYLKSGLVRNSDVHCTDIFSSFVVQCKTSKDSRAIYRHLENSLDHSCLLFARSL